MFVVCVIVDVSLVCRVGNIVNVTVEIDNFFPGMFNYCNVRVTDEETTDLMKHWHNTYEFINRARLFTRAVDLTR